MPLIKSTIVSFFLSVLFFYTGYSQSYPFKNYSTEQGLAQSQVWDIYQDDKGFVWFGTNNGGVSNFDGNTFTTLSSNDGLINNLVLSITQNHKKDLVFGTSKGLSVYNGNSFKNYTEKKGLKNLVIFKVLNVDTTVWLGTQQGVYTLNNDSILPFTKDTVLNKSSVKTIFKDKKNNLWFGTLQNGVVFYNTKQHMFKYFNTVNGLTDDFIFSINQLNDGTILVGTENGLNSISTNFKVKQVNTIGNNQNIAFSSILPIGNNKALLGTFTDGIIGFNFKINQRFVTYNKTNGITDTKILSIFKDRENNLWFGTDGAGVYKSKQHTFVYHTQFSDSKETYINAISSDKAGNLWLGLKNNGIFKLTPTGQTNYKFNIKTPNALADNNINTILPLSNGNILFGTCDGLTILANQTFTTISDFNFRHQYILSLFEDSKHSVWIGTNGGLYKYTDNSISEVKAVNDFKVEGLEFLILSINEDKNGAIWVGTENGVIKYHKAKAILYNTTNGFISSRVKSIVRDAKNNLWLATSEGLFCYKNHEFVKFSQKNGLSSDNIVALTKDNNNRLIIGLNSGVDILDLTAYYTKNSIEISHLGKEDGLLSLECNYNAMFKDKDGRILIGTPNGLEIYNPNLDVKNTIEPQTHITSVKLFFGQEDLNKYVQKTDSITLLPKFLELPFNKNHLTFQFIGISLTIPEKVKYQYKLEGLDDVWTPASYNNEATYSSLPPGNYTFMVKAMNNDGLWNKEPVTFSFTILAPWYKTWWFYSLCVILLLSGIGLYNFIKTKKLVADKQKLETQVTERTKELREEKEKVEIINKEVIEQKAIIEYKNEEITDSIKYAKNIQEALLPSLQDIASVFTNSFVLYMPKDIVSGDFYWFAQTNNNLVIAAVDCTGHGVPGAFMSIVGNNLLREIVVEKNITTPGDILLELHKGVKNALHQSNQQFERRDGMDICLCSFDKNFNQLQYAGANRPLWIYRKKGETEFELEITKASKFPIGGLELDEVRQYQNHTLTINKGDCIYLFSDGYADQFGGPKGKKFMLSNLQKTILQNINTPMSKQKETLTHAFLNWKENSEQVDDVLIIGITV